MPPALLSDLWPPHDHREARVGTGARCTDAHRPSSRSSVTPAHGESHLRVPLAAADQDLPLPPVVAAGHLVPGWCASWCSLRVTLMWMPVGTVSSTVFCILRLLNILNTTPYVGVYICIHTYYLQRSHLNTAILRITLLFIYLFYLNTFFFLNFWLRWVFAAAHGPPPVAASTVRWGARASRRGSVTCCGARAPGERPSVAVAHGH